MPALGAIRSDANVVPTGQIAAVPGATVSLDVSTGTVAKWIAAQNCTVNLTGARSVGQELTLIITNGPTTARVITFGTGFRAGAAITGVINRTCVTRFVCDGTSFFESARTLSLV